MQLLSSFLVAGRFWGWLLHLGGPGLILLGIVDNSAIPVPGSMDALVVVLSAHRHQLWFYYGLMATAGAVVGGYLTYRLAEKGGEETLEKKIGKKQADKVYGKFKQHGFATVAIGAILPPPFPIVPVLLAAGALQSPRRNFLAALGTGRAVRFMGVAYLAHLYGRALIDRPNPYYHVILYVLAGFAVASVVWVLFYQFWYKPRHERKHRDEVARV